MMMNQKVILSFLMIANVYAMNYPGPLEFFEQEDASHIIWSHRTNSQEALAQALKDSTMMIEADVLMGKLNKSDTDDIPIMAHPPNLTSDLSLKDFLDKVKAEKDKKGIKLDFKDAAAVEPSLKIIEVKLPEHNLPLMLNADILKGPINATAPTVPADNFLSKSKELAPSATLSVGWTTVIPENYTGELFYGEAEMKAMKDALKTHNISQPLTFPVRAAMCQKKHGLLKDLIDTYENSTLTVWSVPEDEDHMDYKALVQLQEHLGAKRVYFDLPEEQMHKFEDAADAAGAPGAAVAPPLMMASLLLVWFFL